MHPAASVGCVALKLRHVFFSLIFSAAPLFAQADVHLLAKRIDAHYNHLGSLQTGFTERYSGMGQVREEHGTLLLKKPGRMRWDYADGKVFVLDVKYAISYTSGDAQAQRVPAKQLDDLRSPLRFLLGHTQLEKELDHLTATEANGAVTLTGVPRYQMGAGEQRVQRIAVTVDKSSCTILALEIVDVDGSLIRFDFSRMQEGVAAPDTAFQFKVPTGVVVVDGLPPA